jgi:AmiR/NasT family two-component response regulator
MAACTTVVLAAPRGRTRAAMRAALDPRAVRVAGEACTRWDAGECARATDPDVVVADADLLSMRDFFLSGWGPVSRETRIVAVGPADDDLARRLALGGVAAYVVRDRVGEELAPAVTAARPSFTR